MKNPLSIILLCFITSAYSQVGGSWVKKADVSAVNRESAIGFAINSSAYIGLGNVGGSPNGTLWEYNSGNNTWTQKANKPGGGLVSAVAFVVNNIAYIGTGEDISFTRVKQFYQYNPASNIWSARPDFGGSARAEAVGFAIGSKGYIGTGNDGARRKDFWEYDQANNTWTQKADFGGSARSGAVGFAINNKGYIGTGNDGTRKKDFWEYDPATNAWTQKKDFGGSAREGAVGFSLSGRGYIGTGDAGTGQVDIWEYNPGADEWVRRADFIGDRRYVAVGFASSQSNKGYIGTGFTDQPSIGVSTKDFYEFTPPSPPAAPSAAVVTKYSANSIRIHWLDNSINETGFTIERSTDGTTFTTLNSVAANVTTYTDNGLANGQKYYYRVRADKTTDGSSGPSNITSQVTGKNEDGVWTTVFTYSGAVNMPVGSAVFTINNIIYLNPAASKEVWAFDPATNTYTQRANFEGTSRSVSVAFVLDGKGYIGTGRGADITEGMKDFWQYDPQTNLWTQKADLGATGRSNAAVFTVGGKAYVGGGTLSTDTPAKDFHEYDPAANTWTAKADFPFTPVSNFKTTGGAYRNKGYIIYQGQNPCPFFEYDPANNSWTQRASFPVKDHGFRAFETLQNRFFASTYTYSGNPSQSTLWEFEPDNNRWIERAIHNPSSQDFGLNVAVANEQLYYFHDKSVFSYNPLYGIRTPGLLTAEIVDPVKILLTWTVDPSATKVEVYRATNEAGPFALVGEESSDKTSYVDNFNATTQDVYYKIRVINNTTQSDFSKVLSATKRGAWRQLKNPASGVFGKIAIANTTRGYVGIDASNKTWWEYNPETDSWTQKANFPGKDRMGAASFSIDEKIYVGLGYLYNSTSNTYDLHTDVWQYDPSSNAWSQKKDFPASGRMHLSSATGNGKGYIVGGEIDPTATSFLNEAWEYSPSNDSWTQLANLPVGMAYVNSFVKDNKLWVLNGGRKINASTWGTVNEAYQLDLTSGTWSKGPKPYYSIGSGHVIDDVVYFLNTNFFSTGSSLVRYNVKTSEWSVAPEMPDGATSLSFSINKKIYALTSGSKLWVYNPNGLIGPPEKLVSQFLGDRITLSWQQTSSFPVKSKIQYRKTSTSSYTELAVVDQGVTGFTWQNPEPDYNYQFTVVAVNENGEQSVPSNSTLENSGPYWTKLGDGPGQVRNDAISLANNDKLYYGLGKRGEEDLKDFWEYDLATGVWTQKADYAGSARSAATSFTLNNVAYVGFGSNKNSGSLAELWKYNASTNTWETSLNYPVASGISSPGVVVYDQKAYLLGGFQSSANGSINQLWSFDGSSWVELSALPGANRQEPIIFALGGKIYVGSGIRREANTTHYGLRDMWEYTIGTNAWKQLSDVPSDVATTSRSFSISGPNNAIVFHGPNSSAGGIQSRLYSPLTDKWSSFNRALYIDYVNGQTFAMAQDASTGFAYVIVNHYEYGAKLWRYNHLLDGPNLVEVSMTLPKIARLKWRKITPQADSVAVFRSEVMGVLGARIGSVKNADTTWTNPVSAGKTYYYSVRSYKNSGQYRTSTQKALTVENVPAAPINLTGEQAGDSIILSWQPGIGPAATEYAIERAVDSDTDFTYVSSSKKTRYSTANLEGTKLSYRVKAINSGGESPYSNVVAVTIITGIEEHLLTVSAYPNPTTDYVNIEFDAHDAPLQVQFLDVKGNEFYNNILQSSATVDVRDYPTGMYIVTLSPNKSTSTSKVIKIIKK